MRTVLTLALLIASTLLLTNPAVAGPLKDRRQARAGNSCNCSPCGCTNRQATQTSYVPAPQSTPALQPKPATQASYLPTPMPVQQASFQPTPTYAAPAVQQIILRPRTILSSIGSCADGSCKLR